jgi:CheY-like chemotaxis protein
MIPATPAEDRALVRGLLDVLRPALVPHPPEAMQRSVRDVAQLLGLPGLDAALAESLRHQGPTRPREVSHVLARLARVADAAEAAGSLAPFRESDRELAAHAAALAGMEWTSPVADAPAVAAVPVEEVLGEWPVPRAAGVERARLAPATAAALRAALDWIVDGPAPFAALELHDTAMALTLVTARPEGLALAGAALGAAGGALLAEDGGRWMLRLPLLVERGSYLLVRQGHLALALPWASVARLRMLDPAARAALPEPVLHPFTTAAELHGERPSALLALGLTRAWCVAERVVWRIVAQPVEADRVAPGPGFERCIEVESGERYWVVEPAWALRRVEPARVPEPQWRPRHVALPGLEPPRADQPAPAPATDDGLTPLDAATLAAPTVVPAAAAPPEPVLPIAPAPHPLTVPPRWPELEPPAPVATLLDASLVEPLSAPAPVAAPAPAVVAAPAPPPVATAVTPGPRERPVWHEAPRALVIDDSMVARLFLGRLLERRGFVVEHAADAAQAWDALAHGPWALVCADVVLPDARGRTWLDALARARAAAEPAFDLVALTRDSTDERLAESLAIVRTLRKPFDGSSVDRLLEPDPIPDPD